MLANFGTRKSSGQVVGEGRGNTREDAGKLDVMKEQEGMMQQIPRMNQHGKYARDVR